MNSIWILLNYTAVIRRPAPRLRTEFNHPEGIDMTKSLHRRLREVFWLERVSQPDGSQDRLAAKIAVMIERTGRFNNRTPRDAPGRRCLVCEYPNLRADELLPTSPPCPQVSSSVLGPVCIPEYGSPSETGDFSETEKD
jgi:hypothetical protein